MAQTSYGFIDITNGPKMKYFGSNNFAGETGGTFVAAGLDHGNPQASGYIDFDPEKYYTYGFNAVIKPSCIELRNDTFERNTTIENGEEITTITGIPRVLSRWDGNSVDFFEEGDNTNAIAIFGIDGAIIGKQNKSHWILEMDEHEDNPSLSPEGSLSFYVDSQNENFAIKAMENQIDILFSSYASGECQVNLYGNRLRVQESADKFEYRGNYVQAQSQLYLKLNETINNIPTEKCLINTKTPYLNQSNILLYKEAKIELCTIDVQNMLESNEISASSYINLEADRINLTTNPYSNLSAEFKLTQDSSNNYTNLDIGWNYSNSDGALLGLRSTDFSGKEGYFDLYARDGSNSSQLSGSPAGELSWNGSLSIQGNIQLKTNGIKILGTDTLGNARDLVQLNAYNNYVFAYGGYDNDQGNTDLYGNVIHLYSKQNIYLACYNNAGRSGSGYLQHTVNLESRNDGFGQFLPYYDNDCYLGNSGRRWKEVYATVGTINSSDKKLKENIKELTEQSKNLIMNLRPIKYTRVNDDSQKYYMGFIAQEVFDLVHHYNQDLGLINVAYKNSEKQVSFKDVSLIDDEQLNWGLNYSELIAPLVATVQIQQKEIDNLRQQVEKLNSLFKI